MLEANWGAHTQLIPVGVEQEDGSQCVVVLILNAMHDTGQRLDKRRTLCNVRQDELARIR
jgi:hypothetical protein